MLSNKSGFKITVLLLFCVISAMAKQFENTYSDLNVEENAQDIELIYHFQIKDLPADIQAQLEAIADKDHVTNKIEYGGLLYYLENFSDDRFSSLFEISHSGYITPAKKIDYESLYTGDPQNPGNVATFEIVAKNTYTLDTFAIKSKITIHDRNEQPTITEAGPFYIEEIPSNRSVGFIKAVDPDSCSIIKPCPDGENPKEFNRLEYFIKRIIEVDGSTDFPFELNIASGEITLKQGAKLDYAKQKEYAFMVNVRDRSTDSYNPMQADSQEVKINVVQNKPPKITAISPDFEVKENTDIGTTFGEAIIIYDEDSADSSDTTDKLTISIIDNGEAVSHKSAQDFFEVVRVSKTNSKHETEFKLAVKKDLDYEELYQTSTKSATFKVTLTATDQYGNKITKDTKIKVIDVNEEPRFEKNSYDFTLEEYTGTSIPVGFVTGWDPDYFNEKFGTLYYSLDDSNKKDDATQFKINQNTGEIYAIDKATFNDKYNTFTFGVVATDKEFIKKIPVTVTVKNYPETPTFVQPPKFAVDENSPKGTKVGVVEIDRACSEAKKNNCAVPKYSLAAANGAANDYKAFSIDDNGVITVAQNNILDYEVQNKYVIRVVAANSKYDWLYSSTDVTIHVIDDPSDNPASSSSQIASSSSHSKLDPESSSSRDGGSSSSTKVSSSSAKASSSSVAKSSSSIAKSSSSKAKSSSSKKTESSSSKAKSSSSKKSDAIVSPAYANNNGTSFYVRTVGPVEFDIVMNESSPSHTPKYVVLDMKGQVLSVGRLNNKDTRVKVPTPGAYIVKIGIDYKLVKIR